jgi:hypothetical protein
MASKTERTVVNAASLLGAGLARGSPPSESSFSAWPAALSFFVTRRRPVPAELVAAGPGSSRPADTADRGAARSAGARKEGAR